MSLKKATKQKRVTKTIHTIAGGFAGSGYSKLARKKALKEVMWIDASSDERQIEKKASPNLVFSEKDNPGIISGRDDPMVIFGLMLNAEVKRILVDQEA